MVDGHVIRFCDSSHSYFPQCLVLLNLSGTRIKRENVDFSLFDKHRNTDKNMLKEKKNERNNTNANEGH